MTCSQYMLMLAGKEGEREGRPDSECRRRSGGAGVNTIVMLIGFVGCNDNLVFCKIRLSALYLFS